MGLGGCLSFCVVPCNELGAGCSPQRQLGQSPVGDPQRKVIRKIDEWIDRWLDGWMYIAPFQLSNIVVLRKLSECTWL